MWSVFCFPLIEYIDLIFAVAYLILDMLSFFDKPQKIIGWNIHTMEMFAM